MNENDNKDLLSDDELDQSVGGTTGIGEDVRKMNKEELLKTFGTREGLSGIKRPSIYEEWLQANPNNVDKII